MLRRIAQPILEKLFDTEDVVLNWIGDPKPRKTSRKEVEGTEFVLEEVQEYSDGSRRDGAAAGASTMEA